MNKRKSVKQQITEIVLSEIPKSHRIYHELPIEDVIFKWWFTGRQDGLRLTVEGVAAFQLADMAFYDHEFKHVSGQSDHAFMLELNKKIKCPYYIGFNKKDKAKSLYIRFYDSKIAMMVELYGTLREYLDSIKTE